MIKLICTIPVALIFAFWIIPSGVLAQSSKQGDYKLVWAEEFNKKDKPDPANWKFEQGFVRNQELQWYQTDNAWCENGVLIIEGRKETKANPHFEKGSRDWKSSPENIEYTSSSINTSGLHSWKYGRFVMRGKIDISAGLWPAWWTLGVSKQWPSNGEIDIMEYYRDTLLANIATGTAERYKAMWYSKKTPVAKLGGKEWAAKFHIWRMDWTEKEITLFVDDEEFLKVSVDKLYNKDDSGFNPFTQPHYMLLNLAMGGANGGDVSKTRFPNRFEVDYVRVYQK
ncbi:MAG TPA: glycoside hydrolase family 16 protein [Pedobacter sp.]|uniref:glycoside hydrolase family 16 protein n=1 Tax=Pedobacter sp. TaxID=1411316 RepID=UPI002C48E9C8|nr:glycoside hydrolase family 16 protein [Pedobacter sp.]HMI02075.1 glycoside hydrolase family 16 protein [Pedobacter sp.]